MPRTKGTRNIPLEEKAEIVAKKKTGLYSNFKIADEHSIAQTTVDHYNPDVLPTEALALVEQKEREFRTLNAQNRTLVAEVINEKLRDRTIKDGVLPGLLRETNNAHRLENEQATSIVSSQELEKWKGRFKEMLIQLFANFHADLERVEPLSREAAEELVRHTLGE